MNQNALSDQSLKIHKHLTAAFQGFDRMDICMLGVMPDGRIAFANRPAGQMLGYLQKELVGVSIQTVAPEFTSEAWSVFWSAIDQKGFVENHPPLLLRPSSQKEFMAGCIAFRIQSDAEKGCILFLAPSEKMPAAIINVQEHRSELIPMLDVMANPVIAIDAHYKFTFINRAACRSFGATLFEATGKTFHDYLPKKSADSLLKKMQAVITSGVPATYVGKGFLRAKYGDSITLLPFFDPSSCQKRLLAVINSTAGPAADLTAHRPQSDTTPHSLPLSADAADGYRAMETGAIGICLKDACNRLVWMNQSFAAMVGFEPKDLIGKRPDDVERSTRILHLSSLYIDVFKRPDHPSAGYAEIQKCLQAYGLTSVVDIFAVAEKITEGINSIFPVFDLHIDENHYLEIIDAARSQLADLSSDLLSQVHSQAKSLGQLRQQVGLDGMTQLYNHQRFHEILEKEIGRACRYKTPLSIIMADVDHFKSINDFFGHQAGDQALKCVAAHLKKQLRDSDQIARYGGEEFAVIMPLIPAKEATLAAERLRSSIESLKILHDDRSFSVTMSFGVASWENSRNSDIEGFIKEADEALYEAKNSGRNRVCLYQKHSPRQEPAFKVLVIDDEEVVLVTVTKMLERLGYAVLSA